MMSSDANQQRRQKRKRDRRRSDVEEPLDDLLNRLSPNAQVVDVAVRHRVLVLGPRAPEAEASGGQRERDAEFLEDRGWHSCISARCESRLPAMYTSLTTCFFSRSSSELAAPRTSPGSRSCAGSSAKRR